MTPNGRQIIFNLISLERQTQITQWGDQRHPPEKWLAILIEEIGEVAQAILNHNPNIYDELIQSAAVIVAWLEAAGPCIAVPPQTDTEKDRLIPVPASILAEIDTCLASWTRCCQGCGTTSFTHKPDCVALKIERLLSGTNEL